MLAVRRFVGEHEVVEEIPAQEPEKGQHLGIFLVELGVGTTVAATMVTVFFTFAGRGRP